MIEECGAASYFPGLTMNIFLAILVFICLPAKSPSAPADSRSEPTPQFQSLKTLKSLPHVQSVKVTPAKTKRKRQILHILDYHFVDEKTHGIDIRDAAKQKGVTLTDAEVAADWELFLSEVKAVQAEQMALLRSLAKSHGLKAIHMESVTVEGIEGFRRLVGHIWDYKPRGNRRLDLLLNEMHEHDTLLIGAPGRLMMTGEIEVLPIEDQKLYEAANPVKNSMVKFDEATNRFAEQETLLPRVAFVSEQSKKISESVSGKYSASRLSK